MRILLVRNDNLGDLICTTPAIEALRKKYKNATIDIVVNSYNYLGIRNNPFVDNIFVYTKPKHVKGLKKVEAFWGKLKIFSNIFFNKYDVSVVFRSSYSSSAEQFSNISRAPMRIGVKGKNDKFTHHIEVSDNKHEVEFCFDCLKPLNVKYDGEKTFFYVEDEYEEKFREYKGKILFHISSRVKENKISKEKFKRIFDKLENVIFTAEPNDFENAIWLEQNSNAKWIKTNSLFDLAGVIKNSKLFVSLDGGALHLGPAIKVKTLALIGKTNMDKWYPWGYKNLVLQDESKIAENIDEKLIIEKIKENS